MLSESRDHVPTTASSPLTQLEVEAIDMFINFLKLIGLPKSIGEIYGLLFVAPRPLPMDEIMSRLNISSGAASQGLRLLKSFGAIKTVYLPGSRKDYFAADLEIVRFASVFIKEELQPRMDRALERVSWMESLIAENGSDEQTTTRERLARLKHWIHKGQRMTPRVLRLLVT